MDITPAQLHIQVSVFINAGWLDNMTFDFPGTQGDVVTGTQGIGVNTPKAADVAEATVGLASELHIPKGRIFTIGLKSMMEALGILLVKIFLSGKTINEEGAIPKEHCKVAPMHTYTAIVVLILVNFYQSRFCL